MPTLDCRMSDRFFGLLRKFGRRGRGMQLFQDFLARFGPSLNDKKMAIAVDEFRQRKIAGAHPWARTHRSTKAIWSGLCTVDSNAKKLVSPAPVVRIAETAT